MTDKTEFSSFLSGTALISLGTAISALAGFLVRIVPANTLDPYQYGIYIFGVSIVSISTTIIALGIPNGLAQKIPHEEDEEKLYTIAIIFAFTTAVTCSAILFLYSSELANILEEPGASLVLNLFSLSIPGIILLQIIVSGFQGKSDPTGKFLIKDIGSQVTRSALIVLIASTGAGVMMITTGWILAPFLGVFIGSILIHKRMNLLTNPFNLEIQDCSRLIELLRFSIPLMFSGGLWLVIENLDNLLIGYFHNSSQIGIYDASYTIARIIMVGGSAFGFLLLPELSKYHSKNKKKDFNRLYVRTTKWLTIGTFPLLFIFVADSDTILRIIYGVEYISYSLPIIAIGFAIHMFLGLNDYALISIGKTKTILALNTISAIINILLGVALIPPYGIIGAAISSSVSYFILYGSYSLILYKRMDTNILKWKITPYMSVVVLLIGLYLILYQYLNVIITYLILSIIYVVLLHRYVFDNTDKRAIRNLING